MSDNNRLSSLSGSRGRDLSPPVAVPGFHRFGMNPHRTALCRPNGSYDRANCNKMPSFRWRMRCRREDR
jgi:hypothetical protein